MSMAVQELAASSKLQEMAESDKFVLVLQFKLVMRRPMASVIYLSAQQVTFRRHRYRKPEELELVLDIAQLVSIQFMPKQS